MKPTPSLNHWVARMLAILVPVLALTSLVAFPGQASAGTYTVSACRTAEGGAANPHEWRIDEGPVHGILATRDNCPGGPFELEMSPLKEHPSYDHLRATVEAPAGTEIAGYRFWRSVQLAYPYRYRYRELSSSSFTDLDDCAAARKCYGLGNPALPFDPSNLVQMSGRTGVTGLQFLLTCGYPDESLEHCPATAPGARLQIFAAELTISDSISPVIPIAPSGSLVAPGAHLTGSQPVTISATDTGGGVYQAQLEVDGAVVQTTTLDDNGGTCRQPFITVQPCKTSATGTIALDTSRLADGQHSLRILVTDATGTNFTPWGPVTIQTDNGRCNPLPASGELDMQVGLKGRKKAKAHQITTRYGRSVEVDGRLLRPDGTPVAGAEVCVAEQTAAGIGTLHRVGSRTTDANGYFSYKVGKGPSRQLHFVNRTAGGAAVDSVAVRVRAPLKMQGNPRSLVNGQTLTMRGKLLSPPFPKRGVLVELQAYRETGWQTFATTNTNRRGRFAQRYTFSRTTGVQHYLLRAQVAKQASYPFESGASHPIKVTVAG